MAADDEESIWLRLAAWAIMPLPPMWPFRWPRSSGGRWLIWLPGLVAYAAVVFGAIWAIRYGIHHFNAGSNPPCAGPTC